MRVPQLAKKEGSRIDQHFEKLTNYSDGSKASLFCVRCLDTSSPEFLKPVKTYLGRNLLVCPKCAIALRQSGALVE